MKPILIWLDDWRNPKIYLPKPALEIYDVVWCKSYEEFDDALASMDFPSVVFFDHDLGDTMYSGKDCAKLLIDYCMKTGNKLPEYRSQSMNPIGKKSILSLLDSYKKIEFLTEK